MIRHTGITGGDDSKVGYFAGLAVGLNCFWPVFVDDVVLTISSTPCFLQRKRSQFFTGVEHPTILVGNPSYCLGCLDYRHRCFCWA
jgi:hypothetical protein